MIAAATIWFLLENWRILSVIFIVLTTIILNIFICEDWKERIKVIIVAIILLAIVIFI